MFVRGSSPLARGLPSSLRTSPRRRGIIPARAGFTNIVRVGKAWSGDHPRSRGVYGHTDASPPQGAGSSPLARGLQVEPGPDSRDPGIIPARAGFTPGYDGNVDLNRDHPRSRGVYLKPSSVRTAERGSSPLARGLQDSLGRADVAAGIIPARAGFTRPARNSCGATEDHPRSRGVYVTGRWELRPDEGSSPLARGLLHVPRLAPW